MTHDEHSCHDMAAPASLNRVALSATIHCLTGCAIGEVLGMVIGTALGWGNAATIVLAVGLAFFFGYALTMLPLLRAGMALGTGGVGGKRLTRRRLNKAFYDAMQRGDIAPKLRDQGIEVDFMTPEALMDFIKAEIAKIGDIAKRANVRLSD